MKEIAKSFTVVLFVLLLVASATCYLFVHNSYQRQVFETILWLGLIVFSTLSFLCYPERNKTSWAALSLTLLIGYIVINCHIHNGNVWRLTLYIGALVMGTVAMRNFFANNNHLIRLFFIIAGFLIFSSYLIFFSYNYFFVVAESNNPYQQNASLFGILLASQLLFFLPFWWEKRKGIPAYFNWLFILLNGFVVFLLLVSNGRAGWLGLLIGTIYLCYQSPRLQRIKKKLLAFSFLLVIAVTIILVNYKSGSSLGRKLIYKVSYEMLIDQPLTGLGAYGFSAAYNKYQATYFAKHAINSEEALLADNNWFAFNDYYQFVIENGWIGCSLLFITAFLLFRKKNQISKVSLYKKRHAAVATLIAIGTAALFSYPLQFFPIVFHMLVCLAMLFATPSMETSIKSNTAAFFTFFKITATIVLIVGSLYFLSYNLQEQKAYNLDTSGMPIASLEKYKELSSSPFADGNLLFQYARKLFDANQLKEASTLLNQVKLKYPSNQVYKLAALVHQELGQAKDAEADFMYAVFMVPNRIVHRHDLLSFYVTRQDTMAVDYWSKSILSMPIKVPSTVTRNFQQSAATIRRQFLLTDIIPY